MDQHVEAGGPEFRAATAALYEATLGCGVDWSTALGFCAALAGASAMLLACHHVLEHEPMLVIGSNEDAEQARDLARAAIAIDLSTAAADPTVRARPPAGATSCPRPWTAAAAGRAVLGARLLTRGAIRVVAAAVGGPDGAPFDGDAQRAFERLLPFIERAMRAAVRLDADDDPGTGSPWFAEPAPLGHVTLDERGGLLRTNATALEIFVNRDALTASSLGLRAVRAGDDARLQACIGRALGTPAISSVLGLPRFGSPRGYGVKITPLPRRGLFAPLQPAVSVVIGNPDYRPALTARWCRHLFGLTPRETELAAHLLQGRSLAETADAMGLTRGSLSQYLHRVSTKLGARDRCDMVMTLLAAGLWMPDDAQGAGGP